VQSSPAGVIMAQLLVYKQGKRKLIKTLNKT